MKKLLLMILIGSVIMQPVAGQYKRCGTAEMESLMIAKDPSLIQKIKDYEAEVSAYNREMREAQLKTTDELVIPVVFHIILTQARFNQLGGTSGIEKRVISQINVLNEDFNKGNADSVSIPAAFKPLYGNVGLKFGIAHRKPDGTSTPGYEVRIDSIAGFDFSNGAAAAKHYNTHGLDAWDVSKYLNVWVVNLTSSQDIILGVTTPPYMQAGNETGIALYYGAFGRRETTGMYFYPPQIDKGRTLTHEVGHFFSLAHIWGDDGGACNGSDGIASTPNQSDANYGCPTFPHISCNNGPNGDMFMNYMDYTDDACMNMFTQEQADTMKNRIPAGLTAHPELMSWPTAVAEVSAQDRFFIYPNPAHGIFSISIHDGSKLSKIRVLTMTGQIAMEIAPTTTQSEYTVDLSGMRKGVYLVQCTFASGTRTEKILIQ